MQTDTCVVSCLQFETHVLSESSLATTYTVLVVINSWRNAGGSRNAFLVHVVTSRLFRYDTHTGFLWGSGGHPLGKKIGVLNFSA